MSVEVPFGEVCDDGVWFVSWQERVELLELYVCASGHHDLESAEEEFYSHVHQSKGRWLEKDFEPLPDAVREELARWAAEEEAE